MSFTNIRETDDYPGIRVLLTAKYAPLNVPLSVDVTTGDKITPKEINYTFKLLFDERTINILAYNLETILAEKIETVLSRSVANTRPRDFYDIYILYKLRQKECNLRSLKKALEETAKKRGSIDILKDHQSILRNIRDSNVLQVFWKKYQKDFNYAKEITFSEVCDSIEKIINSLQLLEIDNQ
jgi:predicted nucleotidyltransferase component of viral defense system